MGNDLNKNLGTDAKDEKLKKYDKGAPKPAQGIAPVSTTKGQKPVQKGQAVPADKDKSTSYNPTNRR